MKRLLAALMIVVALGQTAEAVTLKRSVVGFSATSIQSGSVKLQATGGQPAVGTTTNGSIRRRSGSDLSGEFDLCDAERFDEKVKDLQAKVGELTMDNELLQQKIERLEARRPLRHRRSQK